MRIATVNLLQRVGTEPGSTVAFTSVPRLSAETPCIDACPCFGAHEVPPGEPGDRPGTNGAAKLVPSFIDFPPCSTDEMKGFGYFRMLFTIFYQFFRVMCFQRGFFSENPESRSLAEKTSSFWCPLLRCCSCSSL